MAELTRRLFLIGSAAVITAVALPPVLNAVELPTEIIPVPASQAYLRRSIYALFATFLANPRLNEDGMLVASPIGYVQQQRGGEVTLRRRIPGALPPAQDDRLLSFGVGDGGCIYWSACSPLDAVQFLADHIAELEFVSSIKEGFLGEISLTCHDKVDEGPPVRIVEHHRFTGGVHSVTSYFMDADNSLEARLKREEDRKNAIAERERLIAAGIDPYADEVDDDLDSDDTDVAGKSWWERLWLS